MSHGDDSKSRALSQTRRGAFDVHLDVYCVLGRASVRGRDDSISFLRVLVANARRLPAVSGALEERLFESVTLILV